MERKEVIRGAYRLTGGNNFYDGMITCTTLSGKAVCRLVWDMNKAECDAYLEKALSGIPDDFSGKLLEVPVGTGILTMPVYQTLPKADITCLDYSADMMGQAQEKADRLTREALEKNYGIFSVNKRLKTYYGAESGLTIVSAPDQGCTVRVRIFLGRGVTIWRE